MSNLHMECKYCGEPFQVGVDRRTDSLLPPHRCRTGLVQQEEPEGVCAFPNCSCTENRCPAKGERGPFCDHGFHPRLCGRCAPVPEAVTDEDEVQCQMCKTVQPRPDKECGHCGAGPKYLCPIHTRPAAVPVQQEPEGLLMCSSFSGGPTNERCTKDAGHTGLHEGEMLRWSDGPRPLLPGCKTCGAATGETCHEDCPQQLAVAAVPSVGLRDRVACELANLEYERSGRLCETEDFYADADRVLSVHEAGTQGDWQQARTVRHLLDRIIDGSMANGPTDEDINSAESITGWIAVTSPGPAEAGTQEDEGAVNAEEWAKADAGKAYLDHVIATVKKHGRHSDTGCPPGFRAMCSEAMALRAAIEAASAVSGTPDTKEDEL